MTTRPCWRALSTEGTIPLESLGVIRIPFAPAPMRFSIASTCDWLSPSCLPAKDCTLTPVSSAAFCAPSLILTKVFVDRPPSFGHTDSVTTSNRASSREAVVELARLGHRSIGYLGDREALWTSQERHAGYVEGLAECGSSSTPVSSAPI